MNNQQQSNSPITRVEVASEESKHLAATFQDLKSNQLQFLDEAGKSVIERVATFLTVLFGLSVLSSSFPPVYLKDNIAKTLVIITLIFFLSSLGAGTLVIQPCPYKYKEGDVEEMRAALQEMTRHKAFWLQWASRLFAVGALALAALIVSIVLKA
jgi:hypothetical protein